MASELSFYDTFLTLQWAGLDLDGADVRVALLTDDYTFDAEHADYAAVLASGVDLELTTGDGYTAGGALIGDTGVTVESDPKRTVFSGDNVTWSALTATFRYALYYIDGEQGGITDPVLCCVLLDNTPANIVVSGIDYMLLHAESGIFSSGVIS